MHVKQIIKFYTYRLQANFCILRSLASVDYSLFSWLPPLLWDRCQMSHLMTKPTIQIKQANVTPAKNWKLRIIKVEKWQKLTAGLNPNHMHIFKLWKKDVQSCIWSCTYKVPTVYILPQNLRSENDKVHKVENVKKIWGQKMTKFTKWKMWKKLIQGLYPNHMHISRPWRKHVQSLKNIGIKLYEEFRSQGTHCLYNLRSENDKVHKVEKVTKINARIISKPRAHLQTMEKTCAKFEKDWYKIVWGVALTRYRLSIHEVEKWLSSRSGKSDKK